MIHILFVPSLKNDQMYDIPVSGLYQATEVGPDQTSHASLTFAKRPDHRGTIHTCTCLRAI